MARKKVYKIVLEEMDSIQIEQQQTIFMSGVFDLALNLNLVGHGVNITLIEG